MKLNLGCAKDVKDGWVNVDMYYQHPDVLNKNILDLEYEEASIEAIHAHDIIEHLPYSAAIQNLQKWLKWLKKDGELSLQTTNFDKIFEAYQSNVWTLNNLNHMLFAGVNYTDVGSQDCDFHKSVYSKDWLVKILGEMGYHIISVHEDQIDTALKNNPMCHNLNVTILAKK